MLMKSRINAPNDLHGRNLTQPIFEEEVPVEMSHIMALPLSALNGGRGGGGGREASEPRKTTSWFLSPSRARKTPQRRLRPAQIILFGCVFVLTFALAPQGPAEPEKVSPPAACCTQARPASLHCCTPSLLTSAPPAGKGVPQWNCRWAPGGGV